MQVENWYAGVDAEGFIQQFENAIEVADGPSLPVQGDLQYFRLPGPPAVRPQPSPTHRLRWMGFGAEPAWVETVGAPGVLQQVIAAIDAEADAARLLAIGDPARALEYQQAEGQAYAYRAGGYQGEVPDDVASWSAPKGWTGQQAADDIIATAGRWRAALSAIRKLRLASKESARAIAADPDGTTAQLYEVQAQFTAGLKSLMAGIQ